MCSEGLEAMNMEEYQKVIQMTYLQYCDYLQDKYGIGRADYMTKNFNKNSKVSRTSEGLYAHHKMENVYSSLSESGMAKRFPWECQAKENIVYCDALEHLYLHILIAEIIPTGGSRRSISFSDGVYCMMSNLFDVYGGYASKSRWKRPCDDKVREDKDVFFELVKRIVEGELKNGNFVSDEALFFPENAFQNSKYWDKKKNSQIYKEVADHLSNTPWGILNKAVHTLVSKIEDRNNQNYIFCGFSNNTILLKNPQNKNEASIIKDVTEQLIDFDCIDEISLLRCSMSGGSGLLKLGSIYGMAQGKELPDDIRRIPEGDSLPDVICNSDCDYLIKICVSYTEKERFHGRKVQSQYHSQANSSELYVNGFTGRFNKIIDAITGKIIATDTVILIMTRADFLVFKNDYDYTISSVLGGFYLRYSLHSPVNV